MRLDRFLRLHGALGDLGRRRLTEALVRGGVRVNGTRARKGTMVQSGDTITFAPQETPAATPTPAVPALIVLYADEDVIAIDKPPGLPTTVGRRPGPSLAAALLDEYPAMAAFGDHGHAGLVHRLDTGTSGLLLAARNPEAHVRLRTAFAHKQVAKEYLAVVVGKVTAPFVVSTRLTRHRRSRGRMVLARTDRGWPARTEVTPLGGDADLTVVRLHMRTGVTHQLRVHLASVGHAVVGDTRYGDPRAGRVLRLASDWHFLHARAIAFDDPELSSRIATPFPAHWRPLFAARGWPTVEE
jgi:RluA family pseudouridine synthase